MHCPKCNFENSDNARFCNQCAASLIEAQPEPQPAKNHVLDNPTFRNDLFYNAGKWWAKQSKDVKTAILTIGAICLLMVIPLMDKMLNKTPPPSEYSKYATSTTPNSLMPTPAPVVTSTQHLITAKNYLAGTIRRADLEQAQEHLHQVSQGTMEYAEAQELLKQIKAGKFKVASEFEEENEAAIAALRQVNKEITYAHLKKNSSKYIGDYYAFTGKIVQIQEGGGRTVARVGMGSWSADVIYVEAPFTTDFIENNRVFVIGKIEEDKTYESQAGWNITIPQVTAIAMVKPGDGEKLKSYARKVN